MSGPSRLTRPLWRIGSAIDRVWFAPVPAVRLATLRVLVGGFAVVYLVARAIHLMRAARAPAHAFDPVGPVIALTEALPPVVCDVVLGVTLLSGLAFVSGWKFRWSGPIFAAGFLWVLSYRNSWGMIFHTENLLVLHVMILGLAPAADAYAIRPRRPQETIHGRYGWPIRLMGLVTVMTYVIAGLAKLRNSGLEWIVGDILRNYVAFDNLRKAELGDWYSPLGAWLVHHGWLFPPLAALSLGMELAAPVALLWRSWAVAWAACAWSFHVGVLFIMAIVFPYHLLGFAYLPFFEVEGLPRWLRRWWPSSGELTPEVEPEGKPHGRPDDPRVRRAKNA